MQTGPVLTARERAHKNERVQTIALLAQAIPAYRQRPFTALAAALGDGFHVYAGERSFEVNIQTDISLPGQLTTIRNRFLFGGRLLWQSGAFHRLATVDVAILELNPRILSVWCLLVLRRLRGKRSILWGHAWPRAGRDASSDRVRHALRRLADVLLVYTETQAHELRLRMPQARVYAAPNAIYSSAEIRPARARGPSSDFVYVGRLIASKKPALLLDAFRKVRGELPPECRLVFVGAGPIRQALEETVRGADLADAVILAGEAFDRESLEAVYGRAIAAVSPGTVGLSIVQSLSFGVPMLVARDEPHGPEIEAAVEGETAVMFDCDSSDSLARALVEVAANRERWLERRAELADICASRYSIEVMIEGFVRAVRST